LEKWFKDLEKQNQGLAEKVKDAEAKRQTSD
jgi:hypothetical protein